MLDLVGNHANTAVRRLLLMASLAVLIPIAACKKQTAPAPEAAGPKTFASPEDAGKTLADAAKSQSHDAILVIFGPGSSDIISSGNPAEDKASLAGFAEAYQAMNRWRKLNDGSELLLVGTDNQAFPIPLKKNAAGLWYFNAAAGKEEILARRIGRDEIVAVDVFPGKEHLSPPFLALNPSGRLPILRDGDLVLHGTEAILAHLARDARF